MVVSIKNLVKRYGDLVVVDHLNLDIEEGEILGLLGPNGSGKTTTINCILSLLKYDKGTIQIFGEDMSPDNYNVKQQIGVVMQDVAVFDELTVYENVDYFCSLYIPEKDKRIKCVYDAIHFVGLEEFIDFYPKKLSGGLLRRLNIACGIAHKPKLIILDEPTVAVDPRSRNNILEGIKELNRNGATIIYTSHYMDEVEKLCTKIAIIDKGHIIASGTKEELKAMISVSEKIVVQVFSFDQQKIAELKKLSNIESVQFNNNILTIKSKNDKSILSEILKFMDENNISYGKIYSELPTLNDVFLNITGKHLKD